MAYYDALVTKWATLGSSQTTQQKLDSLNSLTLQSSTPLPLVIPPSAIINAIVPSDLATLPSSRVAIMSLLLSGSAVDVSKNTTIRAGLQNIFSGSSTTLANLAALAASYDAPMQSWAQQNGYNSLSHNDLVAAGGLT